MTTVLRLDHVTKAFGPVKVIQDVSVDVIPGRVRVLLGENGAGKDHPHQDDERHLSPRLWFGCH